MALSGMYGAADETEAIEVVHRAIECGVTHLDTSDSYGNGHNEELLGRALRGRRDEVVLSTKFGIQREGLGRPKEITAALEASLRRLDVDHVDMYYMHRPDRTTPVEESVGAMAELAQAGKIRHIGLSEVSAERLRVAHATYPIAVVQQEYSLLSREPEEDLLPTMRELGVGLVAYSPLSRGLLSGAFREPADVAQDDPRRRRYPRFGEGNLEENLAVVRRLDEVATRLGLPLAVLAIAWVLDAGEDVVPLIGTRSPARLKADLRAAEVVLDDEVRTELARIAPIGVARGERYNATMSRRLDRP